MRRIRASRRGGFATLIVVFALGIATIVLVSLQASAFRQAAAGREAAAEVRARWAARAGLEAAVSILGSHVEDPDDTNAYGIRFDFLDVASGSLAGARFEVVHVHNQIDQDGPADPHAKVNVNLMSFNDLMELSGMTEDVAAAIIDWIDEDDIVSDLGAEQGYYAQLPSPYEPRNGPMRSLLELELVAGVDPLLVRGEDWDLNGRLDPNEDDRDASWPPDNGDGALDAGWSELITTESVDGGLAWSGQERIDLTQASTEELIARLGFLNPLQAEAIIAYASQDGVRVEDFASTPLSAIAQSIPSLAGAAQAVQDLDGDQVEELISETTVFTVEDGPVPGRVNLNSCSRELLDYIEIFRGDGGEGLADLLMFERDRRVQGFVHMLDLLDISVVSPGVLAQISRFITVQSNAYVVTARGRDVNTGIEVEIVATIERTALPIVITELTVR